MNLKLFLGIGAGVGVLALLATKKAAAADPAPPPAPHTAQVVAGDGVHTRTGPATTFGVVGGASGASPDDAFTGSTVTVLQTGIASSEPTKAREWWQIVTPGGATGFAAAVGPDGKPFLQMNP